MVNSSIDPPDWTAITPTLLEAWKETERRGAQLLFVIPFFGVPLLAAAYWGIPQTPVPALIVLAMMGLALGYVSAGRRRLRTKNVLWLRSRISNKRIHQSTNSSTRDVSRRHYLTLEQLEALALTRAGELIAAEAPSTERSTTTAIYERVEVGDAVWAAVMPHDDAIYFIVTADGQLVGGSQTAAEAAEPTERAGDSSSRSASGP